MKGKIVLLVVATVGTAALVASAQQEPLEIAPDNPQDRPVVKGDLIVQPGPQVLRPAGPSRKTAFYTYQADGQPTFWATPDVAAFSSQAEQLARQLTRARSDAERDKIKAQLSEVLEKQFDERQKRHEQELKALEAQVKQLKDLVDKRQENRREIIGARLNQIVKEAQGLGW